MRAAWIFLWVCVGVGWSSADAAERAIEVAGLDVTVWSVASADDASAIRGRPVVIFSHGFHGCATQSRFLMDALASAGFVVLAPNHRDATCNGGSDSWRGKPELSFRNPARWDDKTYQDRADDIRRLITTLQVDVTFQPRIDWSRLGLAGHSLGGYTVLGLGGAWESWALTNVKGILALSPYASPFVDQQTLARIAAPVMYQGGTRDVGVTPVVQQPKGAYDQTTAPKYFVELDEAGHFAWTNLVTASHTTIAIYSVAFMNHYVKGVRSNAALSRKLPGVSRLQYVSELGEQ